MPTQPDVVDAPRAVGVEHHVRYRGGPVGGVVPVDEQSGGARTAERLAEVYADAMARPREASINDAEALTGIPTAVIP